MQTLLNAKELWGLINMSKVMPKEEDLVVIVTYTKKEGKAQNLLFQSLSNNQLMIVQKETTAHGIWEVLEKGYVDKGLANKIFLIKKFFMSQMNHNDIMEQNVNKLGAMVKELDAIRTSILDEIKVVVFLMSLPKSY
jgi:DNA primase large subunit